MGKPIIYTIGHSTHSIDEFIALLRAYDIKEIVDIRTIPMSHHNPQFNEETLKASLQSARIRYKHLKTLGGLRHTTRNSINLGWRNVSFRGFADYMASDEFERGLQELIGISTVKNTAIMCAEAVPWRCHRSLIADALMKKGWLVRDIMSRTSAPKHSLTSFLKVKNGQIIYPQVRIKSSRKAA